MTPLPGREGIEPGALSPGQGCEPPGDARSGSRVGATASEPDSEAIPEPFLPPHEAEAVLARLPPDDPALAEADALHLEDHRLYGKMANLVVIVLILHLFFLAPFLAALAGADRFWRLLAHLLLSLPVYAAAWWVWRRGLLPWGGRIVLRGKAARQAAALAVALDLLWIGWRMSA